MRPSSPCGASSPGAASAARNDAHAFALEDVDHRAQQRVVAFERRRDHARQHQHALASSLMSENFGRATCPPAATSLQSCAPAPSNALPTSPSEIHSCGKSVDPAVRPAVDRQDEDLAPALAHALGNGERKFAAAGDDAERARHSSIRFVPAAARGGRLGAWLGAG